jgi:ABC-2 type transport system permease protein
MNQFTAFVLKEMKHIFRDRRTMLILFGMPVVMMLLFGFAIRNDIKDVRTIVVTSTVDAQTQRMVDALNASEYFTIVATVPTPAQAEQLIRRQEADLAIVFGQQLANRQHEGISVQLITDAVDPNMGQQYAVYAQNILMPIMGAMGNRGYWRDIPSAVSTKMLYNPQMLSAYNFVPGIMGMLLMLICSMMTSVSIAREKEKGTMEVLLVSPIKPLVIILAKAVPYMLLGIGILVAILSMSHFVLQVPLAGSLVWIAVISLIYILLSLSIGLFISNVAGSQLVALLVSAMILLMPTIMLSGLIFPIESMPAVLRAFSNIIPARWYIAAMRKLMIMGIDFPYVMKETLVLSVMTLVLLTFKNRLA